MMEPLARAQPFMVSSDEFNLRFNFITWFTNIVDLFLAIVLKKQYLTLCEQYQNCTTC